MNSTSRTRIGLTVLYGCFFLSGLAGLIYEVVWSRYLALFLGSTGEAHVIILSTYMGGLALGAHLFGKRADRAANALRLYVLLELGIGVLGLLYPRLFEPIRQLYLAWVRVMGMSPAAMHGGALLCSIVMILVPTTLMGGTLPVLGRFLIRSEESIGNRIASLYYLNSFGAVLGSLIGGFWLLRVAGLELSMIVAAVLNLTAALGARALAQIDAAQPVFPPAKSETAASGGGETVGAGQSEEEIEGHSSARGLRNPAAIALVVITLSGFASMVYEVAWIRLLTLVLGSSTFSFALMLSAFISGITLGSFLLSFKKRDRGHFALLGWSEVGIGLTALLTILVYQRLPLILNHWQTNLSPSEHTYGVYQSIRFVLCFLVMLLPTVLMGMTLPAASRVVARGIATLGRRVGDVFALNTIGTLTGAAVGGFVLLPWIGLRHMVEFAVALNVALGLWVLASEAARGASKSSPAPSAGLFGGPRRRSFLIAAALSVLVPAVYLAAAPEWDVRTFTAGAFRIRQRIPSFEEFQSRIKSRQVLYYKDGTDSTVAVCRDPGENDGKQLTLFINGKPDASTGRDLITQKLIAHLPLMLHANPEQVLVVGLGSGGTAGVASLYDDAKHVDCIELIPEVIEAASLFRESNLGVMNNPKVSIIHQDAKTYLQVTDRRYDVIINEPTNPWITGVAGLFTQEYFAMCRERLKDDGLFLQWIQCYELLDPSFYGILATFNDTFPYSTLFNFSATDTAIVGSLRPFGPDFPRMERLAASPGIRDDLATVGIRGILPLLSMQVYAKNDTPGPYTPGRGVYSDLFPLLEYEAAKGFFVGSTSKGAKLLDRRAWSAPRSGLWIHNYHPATPPDEKVFSDYYDTLARYGCLFPPMPRAWCSLWETYYPTSSELDLARRFIETGEDSSAPLRSYDAATTEPRLLALEFRAATASLRTHTSFLTSPDTAPVRAYYQRLLQNPAVRNAGILLALGDLERDAGRPAEAIQFYQQALELERKEPDKELATTAWLHTADACLDLRQPRLARAALEEVARIEGRRVDTIERLLLLGRIEQVEATLASARQERKGGAE